MANIFFGRGKKDHLIIDLSLTGMRGLTLGENLEEVSIDKAYEVRWPYHLSKSPEDFEAKLNEVIKSFASYFPPRQYLVTFCSTEPSNRERFVQLQMIDDEEEMEEFLLSKKLMKNQNEFLSDIHVIGPSISEIKSSQDILIHSCSRELPQYVMDTLEETGYELEALEFPSNSLSYIHNLLCEPKDGSLDAVIYIGWEISMISIFHGETRRFSHMLNFRFMDFLKRMIDKLNIDEEFARALIQEELFDVVLGGKPGKVQYPEDFLNEVREEIAYLKDELKRVLAFCLTRVLEYKVENVDRIFFVGIEGRIQTFYNNIAGSFPIHSKSILPIDEINLSEEVKAKIVDVHRRDSFSVCLGLALRQLG